MADEGFKRKLTAILSADVEGYSILMAYDETYTIKTLKEYLSRIYNQLFLKGSHCQLNFST
jgi:adenylate cyclase